MEVKNFETAYKTSEQIYKEFLIEGDRKSKVFAFDVTKNNKVCR